MCDDKDDALFSALRQDQLAFTLPGNETSERLSVAFLTDNKEQTTCPLSKVTKHNRLVQIQTSHSSLTWQEAYHYSNMSINSHVKRNIL